MSIKKNGKKNKGAEAGVKIGMRVLSVAEKILVALIEEAKDTQYMRTHTYAVLGRDVRSARHESEEIERLHELKMKRQAIERLREAKLIKLRREGKRVMCELTDSGRARAIKIATLSSKTYFDDGRLCLVSFDFPEVAREARNLFRYFLKSSGFSFVQGSVWSIKKDVAVLVGDYISILKIKRWVKVYTAIEDA
jgi:hypothetical protein